MSGPVKINGVDYHWHNISVPIDFFEIKELDRLIKKYAPASFKKMYNPKLDDLGNKIVV